MNATKGSVSGFKFEPVKKMNNLETHEDMHKAWGFKPVNQTSTPPAPVAIKTTVKVDAPSDAQPTTTLKFGV